MRRSFIVLVGAASLALTAAGVLADDIDPPWWRYKDPDPLANRSTLQQWEFETAMLQPIADDGYVIPPTGPLPQAGIDPSGEWIGSHDGRTGIWPLSDSPTSGLIDLFIYNYSGGPEKKIRVQLTWMPHIQDAVPTVTVSTNIAPPPVPGYLLAEQSAGAGTAWVHSTYLIVVQPNPQFEMIRITGDIIVDEVVVDTICPEPATMLLLGLAVPFVLKRRGRS